MEDTWSGKYVVCPYCNAIFKPDYELKVVPGHKAPWLVEGFHDIDCEECGKTFEFAAILNYWPTFRKEDYNGNS